MVPQRERPRRLVGRLGHCSGRAEHSRVVGIGRVSRWCNKLSNATKRSPAGWRPGLRNPDPTGRTPGVLYRRVPRLFADLALARGDGRHLSLLRARPRRSPHLGLMGLEPLVAAARHDLLEILEHRHHRHQPATARSVASADCDPTSTAAILDRLVHKRPPHRSQRREPAANPQTRPEGLSQWHCGPGAQNDSSSFCLQLEPSANGMVWPCSRPASSEYWQGAPKTRSTPCHASSTPRQP